MASASPGEIQFDDILCAEIEAINQRRAALGRAQLSAENCTGQDGCVLNAVGLTLSGGGIRSAAVSLGVLQAINHNNALDKIDYLSTVSGGGYIGSALSATMSVNGGNFVFGNRPTPDADRAAAEIADTPGVGHLRNYSNYLIPRGLRDIITGAAIVLRGLVANLAGIMAIALLFAALTILTNPYRTSLGCPDLVGYELCDLIPLQSFGLSFVAALAGIAGFFVWALFRSMLSWLVERSLIGPSWLTEFRTVLPAVAATYLVCLGILLFVELQTFTLKGMFQLADEMGRRDGTFAWLTATLQTLAAIAAPVAALVTFFRQQMGDILKAANSQASIGTKIVAALSKVAFWVAGAALPLVVWVAYLYLSYWGIINNAPDPTDTPAAEVSEVQSDQDATPQPRRWTKGCPGPASDDAPDKDKPKNPEGTHTPSWLLALAVTATNRLFCPPLVRLAEWENASEHDDWQPFNWIFERGMDRPIAVFYVASGLLLILAALLLRPNANSLHRLYRDRLSKAFLFDPHPPKAKDGVKRNEPSVDQGRDFAQLDEMPVSALSTVHAPYHLINAALNIQGSDYANRRGRDADFFMFSPYYLGSHATGYAATAKFEQAAHDLTLASALAISGAAASSNMGSQSIRPLRPTLALLNIRLGYWLKNPRYAEAIAALPWWRRGGWFSLFLWNEIRGNLYENSNDVYLTDGGHIENLGVYELLRRRCKLIIVVDAESDIAVRFASFITLQRYARIDLGVRIEMPWDDIRETTSAWMGLHNKDRGTAKPSQGPHAAIGCIDYGEGRLGTILYLKASLTGDENDYIRDYARRFPMFPHETTGDQFFSEEQFEVYRALGFHIAHGVLCGRDQICAVGKNGVETCKFDAAGTEMVCAARAALAA